VIASVLPAGHGVEASCHALPFQISVNDPTLAVLALLLRSASIPVTPQVDDVAQETLTGATRSAELPAAADFIVVSVFPFQAAKYRPKLMIGALLLPLTVTFSPVSAQNAGVAQAIPVRSVSDDPRPPGS